ncbi:MAG: DUF748 domain-containing protein [Candidatus Omnitrophica bacterium]|nr:DUF748 domain-containing protein [Candidatus Omnitrophota bacterium]
MNFMHWSRKTIYVLLTVFILVYFVYLYMENIFLPVQFKRFVVDKAQEYLHRPVTIADLHFSPLRGFIVRDITVYQKDDPGRVFLQVDEASFHVFLTPFLKHKLVVIPSVRIKQPFVQIVREDKNLWNFSDLLTARGPSSGPGGWTVAPRKIIIEDGEIAWTDKTAAEGFHEVISGIDLDARVALTKVLRFTLNAQIPRRQADLTVKGNYRLDGRELSSRVVARNIPLARYMSLFFPSEAGGPSPAIRMPEGVLSALDVNLTVGHGKVQAQGGLALEKAALALGEDINVSGGVKAENVVIDWQKGRLDARGHLESAALQVTAGGENGGQSFKGAISADIQSLRVSVSGGTGNENSEIALQGDLQLQQPDGQWAAASGEPPEASLAKGGPRQGRDGGRAGAQTIQANNLVFLKDGRGIHLQTALVAKGLDAAFSLPKGSYRPEVKLHGDLATQKTKLAVEGDKFGVASDLSLNGGRLDWNKEQFLQADLKTGETVITRQEGLWNAKSDIHLDKALLQLAPQLVMEGRPDGNVSYQFDPAAAGPQHRYSGTIQFSQAKLRGVPYVDAVQDIAGAVQFETDKVASDQLTFQTQGADVTLSGSLSGLTDPRLDIRAKTENLDLQRLFAVFPVLAEKTQVHMAGTASVDAVYHGKVKDPAGAEVEADVALKETMLAAGKIPGEITGISGQVHYAKDLVAWKDIQGTYQNKKYTVNGRLAGFSRPVVDVTVISDGLNVLTQINILHQAFQVVTFNGQYLNSSLDIKGDVHLFEDAAPDLDLRGTFTLNLEDLPALVPALKDPFGKIQPVGILSGEGLFKGKPGQWQDWALTFTARAPTVSLSGFYLDDGVLDYEQRDRHISKCNLRGRVYNGDLTVTSTADLTQTSPVMQAAGTLAGTDLAALRESKLPDNKFLAGRLSGFVNLAGPVTDPGQWQGDGSVGVTDGHLWQLNILDGILGALVIPEFTNVVFTDGEARLTVNSGKVYTDDATLNSNTVTLKAKGWVDFNQNIEFDVSPVFSELAADESLSLKKAPSLLLAGTQDYISVKLTGTLRNPRYKVQTMPFKILEKTTDILKEGVGTILKGIF